MEKKTKFLQVGYVLILAISAIFAILSEIDVLPVNYIGNEPHLLYWLNLYAIFVSFGGMFLCLRMFVFKKVKKAVVNPDESKAFMSYYKWTMWRLCIILIALWSNTILYFSTLYTSTSQYCILVTLVSCVFCWPSLSAFRGLRKYEQMTADNK